MRPPLLLLLALTGLGPAQAEEWRVGSFEDPLVAGPFQQILGEAYGRLGVSLRFEPMPLRRSEQLLRAGELDADLARTEAFLAQVPQARRVGVLLRQVDYLGFRAPPCPQRLDREELARMRLTLPRGTLALEAALPPGPRVQAADAREALRYVQAGIAELAVVPVTPALREAAERSGLCAVPEPLLVVKLFHVVQARHEDRVPQLEAALGELQRSGFIGRVWQQAERDYQSWQPIKGR